MNATDHPQYERFVDLATGYLDGVASDEQFEALSQLLHEHEPLREAFVQLSLQTRLVRHLISPRLLLDTARQKRVQQKKLTPTLPSTLRLRPEGRSSHSWRSRSVGYALAAAVALAITAWFLLNPNPQPSSPNSGATRPVAMLTESAFAAWNTPLAVDANGELITDIIELKSGTAQIMFLSGATVTLQGPARFELQSTNGGYLHSGQIIAWVPQQAHGFTVGAPGGAIVDLGTEFGLVVDDLRVTEVHVFDGMVEAEIHDGAGQVLQRRRLTRGQTARLEAASRRILTSNQKPRCFATRMPIDAPHYSEMVLDDGASMYWPLVRVDDQSPLMNLAAGSHPMQAGGPMREQIRGAAPDVLYFDGRSTLGLPGQGPWSMVQPAEFTVESWIWPDAMPGPGHIVLAEPGTGRAGWSLTYEPDQAAAGGHIVFNALGVGSYTFDAAPVSRDRWTHMAVVFDARHNIHLYLDGRAVQSLQASGPIVPSKNHYVKIGGRAAGERWIGRLAHLAYYPTPLSADQIAEHAQSGESQ